MDSSSGDVGPASGRASPDWGSVLSIAVILIAVLAIPLEAAGTLGLSPAETASWIVSIYGLPTALAVILILRYRQPLLLTGNVFV